jgi:hypothetical protein
MLRLAGVARRPARPAAILAQAVLEVGAELTPEMRFQPGRRLRPGVSDNNQAEPIEHSADHQFRPAWRVVGWKIPPEKPKQTKEWIWSDVEVPRAFLSGRESLQAYIEHKDWIVRLRELGSWRFRPDSGEGVAIEQPVALEQHEWLPRIPSGSTKDRWLVPLESLAFAAEDDAEGVRIADRWLTFRVGKPQATDKESVKGQLIWRPLGGKDPSASMPILRSDYVCLTNSSSETSSREAFDRLGLLEMPVWRTAGAEFNGSALLDWSATGSKTSAQVTGVEGARASGGRAAETDAEFLERAPAVLRHRGSPVAAEDWERLMLEADPAERVAGAACHGELFPRASTAAVGVRIFVHAVSQGPTSLRSGAVAAAPGADEPIGRDPTPAARLAAWLREQWLLETAIAVRPLGAEVELFIPQIVKIQAVIRPELREPYRQQLKRRLKESLTLETSGRGGGSPLWNFLLNKFRQNGPAAAHDLPIVLREFVRDDCARLSLRPDAVDFQTLGSYPRIGLTSAAPWLWIRKEE